MPRSSCEERSTARIDVAILATITIALVLLQHTEIRDSAIARRMSLHQFRGCTCVWSAKGQFATAAACNPLKRSWYVDGASVGAKILVEQIGSTSWTSLAATAIPSADGASASQRSLVPLGNGAGGAGSPTRAPRLYVGGNGLHLDVGEVVELSPDQTRYLMSVMRLREGSAVRVFDGINGEYSAVVCGVVGNRSKIRRGKTSGGTQQVHLRVERLTRRQPSTSNADQQPEMPEIELLFAPIRKHRLKILVEKAVEVGASRLTPVLTTRTQAGAADQSALVKLGLTTAIEAAEQSERMTVPHVGVTAEPLASILKVREFRQSGASQSDAAPSAAGGLMGDNIGDSTDDYRHEAGGQESIQSHVIFACKERDLDAPPLLDALAQWACLIRENRCPRPPPCPALLVGPEGGFDREELDLLSASPVVHFVSLGSTVLRAETAALYALSCWSAFWASSRAQEGLIERR